MSSCFVFIKQSMQHIQSRFYLPDIQNHQIVSLCDNMRFIGVTFLRVYAWVK
jgi:hypothetical protein